MSKYRFKLGPSHNSFKFGDGLRNSGGIISLRVPIPDGSHLPLAIDVVEADVPLLVGLDVMDREGLVPDNVNHLLVSKLRGWTLAIE